MTVTIKIDNGNLVEVGIDNPNAILTANGFVDAQELKKEETCKWRKLNSCHKIPHESNWAIYGLPSFCPECGKKIEVVND